MLLRPVHGKRNGGDRGVVTDNWEKIRQDYLTGNESQAALARRYGISRTALSKRIRQEGWKREAAPGWESRLRRVDALADRMLTALERDPKADMAQALNVPGEGAEIISVCDRLITSLRAAEQNAVAMTGMLADMRRKYANPPL